MSWSQNGGVYTYTCTHTLEFNPPDNVTEVEFDGDENVRHWMKRCEIPYGITVSCESVIGGKDGRFHLLYRIISDPKLPKAVGELKRRSVVEYLHGRDLPEAPYRVNL